MTIEFDKAYDFEGTEYTSVDLGGLEKLTVQDAIEIQRQLFGEKEIAAMTVCETTTAFARKIASKATDLPIEFFKMMPRGISRKVLAEVQAFMNVAANTENHVIKFEKPYKWNGRTYTEVDLSGLINMTSMDESEAENQLVRAGFVILETSFVYLYACVLASRVTSLPVEFFTGLPIYEVLKLKNAVNDPDFFE